ncbi:hypothetical protein [Glycomyces sp. NPDC048151]|uniref:hypothetical protein n=1 Tax=Glycomyces sp. NPDC048151 TaxID=3364002 RepID=UPI00371CE8EB
MTYPQSRGANHRMLWLACGAVLVALAVIMAAVLYLVRNDEQAELAASATSEEAVPAEVTVELCEEFEPSGIADVVPETDTGRTDADIGPDEDNAEIETTLTCWWGDQSQWTGWVLMRLWPTEQGAATAVENNRAGSEGAGIATEDWGEGFTAVIAQDDGRELFGVIDSYGRVEAHVYAFIDPAVHLEDAMWTVLEELQTQCEAVFAPFVY